MPPEEEQKELEFKDIARLTNRDVQLVLREIAGKDIALALKGADEDLRDCIFRNVSKRVATMIRDEMKLLAAAKIPDVLEMRSVITTIARGLASSGEITWPPSARPLQAAERPSPTRAQAPPAVRPLRKRSTRRTVAMVAGGLGSVMVLILLATIMGRFARPKISDSEKLTERKRTVASKQKAMAPTSGAVALPGEEAADREAGARAEGAAGNGAGAATVASNSSAGGQPGSEPAAGEGAVGQQESAPGGDRGDESSPALRPGDQVQTEGQSPAVYQLADGAGTLEVDPNSDLKLASESEDPEAEKPPPRLDLRLGNIKVDVTDPELEVTSPLARITATEGSQYRIRVVLDATTTVTVTAGIVWLKPTVNGDTGPMMLRQGDEARISPTGRVSVSRSH